MPSDPTQLPNAAAIFLDPSIGRPRIIQGPMDPPNFADAFSSLNGVPRVQAVDSAATTNRYVRELADRVHAQTHVRTGPHNDPPIAAYAPGQIAEIPIGVTINDIDPRTGISKMSPHMVSSINGIHQTQQANIARNAARGKGKGFSKGKGRGKGEATATPATIGHVPRFKGTDDTCSICTHSIKRGEWCARIECNHVFHEECWTDYLTHCIGECECPNCRGNAETKAFFQYVPSDRSHDAAVKSFEDLRSAAQTARPSSATSASQPSPSATYLVTAAPRSSHEPQPSDTRNHRRAATPPQQFYIGERVNRQTKI